MLYDKFYENAKMDLRHYAPEQRGYIQKALFSIGYEWSSGKQEISSTTARFLFTRGKKMLHASSWTDFKEDDRVQLHDSTILVLLKNGYGLAMLESMEQKSLKPKPEQLDEFLQILNTLKR